MIMFRSEFLVCYEDLEYIKQLGDMDQILSRTTALVWRYKTMYEAVRIASGLASNGEETNSPATLSNVPFSLRGPPVQESR